MNAELIRNLDLIGTITVNIYYLLIITVFIMRLVGRRNIGYWIGLASFLTILPLVYLVIKAFQVNRPMVYFIWLVLMIVFLCLELVIDYILKVEFRDVKWATIIYVIFFFGATGGMIGVAGQTGTFWAITTTLVFVVMGILAFVQRAKTNL